MAAERTRAQAPPNEDGKTPARTALPGERTYREEEVARILQRAAGLERKRQVDGPALSLAEVEHIAAESGIDPSLVRQAARDLYIDREAALGKFFARSLVGRTLDRIVGGDIELER